MNRSHSSRSVAAFAVALTLLAAVAVMATGVVGRTASPAPSPIEVPTATPSVTPQPEPTAVPSAGPTATPAPTVAPTKAPDGIFDVDLDIATAHDVSVVIDDGTGTVIAARSGRAGDGMSVRWHDVAVENVDADTLRITWVGLPVDEVVGLSIVKVGDGLRLDFTEDLRYPDRTPWVAIGCSSSTSTGRSRPTR